MPNTDNEIDIIPISELTTCENGSSKYQFIIPSYQRGYKWSKDEVNYLLHDIWEFSTKTNKLPNEIYCLQPIVVKLLKNNEYELIDGQQRLTTIYLILAYLEKYCFKIIMPTRDRNEKFLEQFRENRTFSEEDKERYFDYWHICDAWKTISDWIEKMSEKEKTFKEKFLECLLNSVKIIWYKVNESVESREIFSRLNVGKIPLTNAELIKAIILSKESEAHEKSKISLMWNTIETTLQDDKVWCFLTNPEDVNFKLETRIDFLLDIVAGKPEEKKKDDRYKYFSFQRFQSINSTTSSNEDKEYWKSQKIKSINAAWEKVEEIFQIIQDWFDDGKIYHYIGYAIRYPLDKETERIQDLISLYKNNSKSDFIKIVKFKIFENFDSEYFKNLRSIVDDIDKTKNDNSPEISNQANQKEVDLKILIQSFLDNQSYISNKNKIIEKILLLFNISTVMLNQKHLEDKNGKETLQTFGNIFPFDLFKKGNKWDIEHVHSQTERKIVRKEEQIDWLYNAYLDGDKNERKLIIQKFELLPPDVNPTNIRNSINNRFVNLMPDEFEIKQKELSLLIESGITNKDSLFNLSLLDCKTNRSYQNAFFPTKRKIIIDRDKAGQFVPICTKNLFQKYYTQRFTDIARWNDNDANGYKEAMTEMFVNLIKKY